MEEILKISALAIISVVLALILKDKSPYFAICIVILCGIYIFFESFLKISEILDEFYYLIELSGVDLDIFLLVLKVSGISVITKITAEICKDASFSSIATKVEFSGAVLSVFVMYPLFLRIIDILKDIV